MANETLLRTQPRQIPDKIGGENVAPVGDVGSVIPTEVSGDLWKSTASRTAVGGISGEAVRPGIGKTDQRAAGEALLQLRLQRIVVGSEEVDKEKPWSISCVRTKNVELV